MTILVVYFAQLFVKYFYSSELNAQEAVSRTGSVLSKIKAIHALEHLSCLLSFLLNWLLVWISVGTVGPILTELT